MTHREEILSVEVRRVSRVCGRRNIVRNSAAAGPADPCVTYARRTGLR